MKRINEKVLKFILVIVFGIGANFLIIPTSFAQNGSSTDNYAYDGNGNVTKDLSKGIANIEYNFLNLPDVITMVNGTTIRYTWDAGGHKWKTVITDSNKNVTTYQYLGNSVYRNDTLLFITTPEGRVRPNATNTGWVNDYFLKDNLGNVRMIITDDDSVSSPILEVDNYYPFGQLQKEISTSTADNTLENKYKYNGKEQQPVTGLYDFGARMYDPTIGRFLNTDPKADQMRRYSPYAFLFDNPMRFIDPDGMMPLDNYQLLPTGANRTDTKN